MSEHTPGPWKVDGTIIYADIGIQPHIADLDCFTDQPEANARRIVDCVNACQGMKDPKAEIKDLRAEVATPVLVATNRLADALAEARAENARLREALEKIADATLETWTSYCNVDGHHELVIKTMGNMRAIARAALRKE